MSRSKVTVSDRGANATISLFQKMAQGTELRVGVLGKGTAPAKGSKDLTVADVATFNEFGLGVPERSFIRGWYDESIDENKRVLSVIQKRVLRGEVTAEKGLAQAGLKFVGDIQRRIVDGIEPPNAESTVKRKGSSTPLVDTGQLKASITAEVSK